LRLCEVASRDFGHKCEHSRACTCITKAIVRACVGSFLHDRASGGFSLKDISWPIFESVRVWKLPFCLSQLVWIVLEGVFFFFYDGLFE
jgi:hypothetical protein